MIEPIGPETLPPPGEVRRPRVGTFIALFLIVAGIVSAIVINQRRIWTGVGICGGGCYLALRGTGRRRFLSSCFCVSCVFAK